MVPRSPGAPPNLAPPFSTRAYQQRRGQPTNPTMRGTFVDPNTNIRYDTNNADYEGTYMGGMGGVGRRRVKQAGGSSHAMPFSLGVTLTPSFPSCPFAPHTQGG